MELQTMSKLFSSKKVFALVLEMAMRLLFICAYAVAVYANLYAHIHMKPHRKIRLVYADMRKNHIYAEKTHMFI